MSVSLRPVASGHVAVELWSGGQIPSDEAFALCEEGQEMSVCAPDIENVLVHVAFSAECVQCHAVEFGSGSSRPAPTTQKKCYIFRDATDTDNIYADDEHVPIPCKQRLSQRRMRAEPFYRECTESPGPGWRARARDLFPAARARVVPPQDLVDVEDCTDGFLVGPGNIRAMASASSAEFGGGAARGELAAGEDHRQEVGINMAYEQRGFDQGSAARTGNDQTRGREGDGNHAAREDSPIKGTEDGRRGSIAQCAQGPWEDVGKRARGGSTQAQSRSDGTAGTARCSPDAPAIDDYDSRGCRAATATAAAAGSAAEIFALSEPESGTDSRASDDYLEFFPASGDIPAGLLSR